MAKPKFNFESLDLDQLINQIWNGQDTKHIHDSNFIFCDSGARRSAILSHGVPYKDIQLVLRPRDDKPPFFYKLAQRHTKNNPDPELRTFGNACSQHRVLRYDSVSIILILAVADGALDLEDLYRMIKNGGKGPVEWSKRCRDMPICREVDRQGNINETKPMSADMFVNMFKIFLIQAGYTARWILEEYWRETSMLLKREKLLNGTCVKAPGLDPDDPIHKLRPKKVRLAEKIARTLPTTNQDKINIMQDMLLLLSAPTVYYRPQEEPKDKKCPFCLKEIESIAKKEHQWPWSYADCEFSGESGDACYHHLHDAHGYQLPKERKFEASSNSASFISQDNSDNWLSEYIQFPPHSPDLSGIAVKGNEIMPSLTLPWKLEHDQPSASFEVVTSQMGAIDDTIHGHGRSLEEQWDCHLFSDLSTNLAAEQLSPSSSTETALAEGMPSMATPFDDREHSHLNTLSIGNEVLMSSIPSASWSPMLTDVGRTGAESAQCHTLDLASTAKSSLALLAACSPDSDKRPQDKDGIICRLKQDSCSWAEIQHALPHRSLGSMQARCRLCQFLLADDEVIVAMVGDDRVSCEFSFGRYTTFYDDELDIKLHTCLVGECSLRTKATVCFHARCHEARFYSITPAFLAATCYTYNPSLSEERRRARYIQKALVCNLQQARLWPRELATELWTMVAGLLLEDCAAFTAQEQLRKCDKAEEYTVDLTQPVYASYVKIDGRVYVRNLQNKARTDVKGGSRIMLLAPGKHAKENEGKDMFVAEDHLGIRQIIFASPKRCDEWFRSHPSTPGAWWKHISQGDIRSTVTIRSDGFKIRDIKGGRKGSSALAPRIGWQVPVSVSPTTIDLLTLKIPEEYPSNLRMRFFDCNGPDTIGYFVATDGARTLAILSHKQDQQVDPSFFEDVDAPICFWIYMPINKGEYLTDICRRAGSLTVRTETIGLTFSTNRGRTVVFGLYGHENVDFRRVAALPHTPCRVYFNQADSLGRRNVEFIAVENGRTATTQDSIPSPPASVSHCPYTQSNEIWIHSSCSMRHLTLVHACVDKSAPHQPVIGMLLYYTDGHRESVGQFRLDWSTESITVREMDRLYICGKRTKQNWGYVAAATTRPPLNQAEGCWLDVAQAGLLEWWFSSRHSVLFYNNSRLN
ncbi:hypothetical protein F66182_8821 [Fusarium sp. NRRL 66182]|nr:hypothetical protein F66182_8821 [Fusarium sp. NRRL 66182]